MGEVLDTIKDEIDKTIRSLDSKNFEPDPIAGKHFSKITSVMSSAYKRHGYIIEHALLEALKLCPRYKVWRDDEFQVPPTVDHIAAASITEPTKLIGTDYPYSSPGHRTLQVDVIVYDHLQKTVKAYEVKRGFGLHDSGKRRSMMRDALAVQILLKSYAREKGCDAERAFSHVVFYYGKTSMPKPFSLIGSELNEHFDWDVHTQVEEVNAYFQTRLFAILSGS